MAQLYMNDNETLALREVIDYLEDDEKRHYQECVSDEPATDHIYLRIKTLKNLLNKSVKN